MSQYVNYMLRRTASLILTDCRCTNSDNNSSVRLDVKESKNKEMLYLPSLFAINIVRLWTSFEEVVLVNLSKLEERKRNTKPQRNIDWNTTFENISKGTDVISYKIKDPIKDKFYVYLITVEYLIHIEEVLNFYSINTPPKDFYIVLTKLNSFKKTIDDVLDHIELSERLSDIGINFYRSVAEAFNSLISNHSLSKEDLRKYTENTLTFFESIQNYNKQQYSSFAWRNDYMSLNTGLGKGKDILISPTTDIPHLYELWCFYEFTAVLIKKRKYDIAQYSYITSNKDLELFSINNLGKIYYNYLGKKLKKENISGLSSKILKRTCVEWYIEFMNQKIVFDTKFKKWSSNDNLTVMGYMNDFDADTGVVIFSESFDSKAYTSNLGTNKIICTPYSKNKKFIALQLTPSIENQEINEETLSNLVDYLFD